MGGGWLPSQSTKKNQTPCCLKDAEEPFMPGSRHSRGIPVTGADAADKKTTPE